MFLNHDTDFAAFAPATATAAPATGARPGITLAADTLLETTLGWRSADMLEIGDAVATRDGGFACITAICAAEAAPMIHVPGGTLSSCSDCTLPADSFVALDVPMHVTEAPLVCLPLRSLIGWNGIRPAHDTMTDLATFHFAEEELIFAQTGLMLHAAAAGAETFFDRLDDRQARALLRRLADRAHSPFQAAA